MEVVDFIIGDLITTLSSRPLMSMVSGFITTLGNLLQMSMIMLLSFYIFCIKYVKLPDFLCNSLCNC